MLPLLNLIVMISSFINLMCLIIAFVLICVEQNIKNKIVENTYSFKYEGRYIYDPEKLAKRRKITTIVAVANLVVATTNLILAIWAGV